MLFAFVGQVTAFTPNVACDEESSIETTSLIEQIADHSEEAIDCCGIDCCDSDCICATNACSTASFVNTEMSSSRFITLSESTFTYQSERPNSILTLLYRPPIFTS